MDQPQWDKKHTCPVCGAHFYNRRGHPPICPKCTSNSSRNAPPPRHASPNTFNTMGQLDHDSLAKQWIEALSILADYRRGIGHHDARQLVEDISAEWKRRRQAGDYFQWPSTDASPGVGSIAINSPSRGMLSYLGYRVGNTGESRDVRRQMLIHIFSRELPPLVSKSYMDEWCEPGSPGRLEKMAHSIAAFARNAKRRNVDAMTRAIEDWESDLNYLRNELYIGRFAFDRFVWPSTFLD